MTDLLTYLLAYFLTYLPKVQEYHESRGHTAAGLPLKGAEAKASSWKMGTRIVFLSWGLGNRAGVRSAMRCMLRRRLALERRCVPSGSCSWILSMRSMHVRGLETRQPKKPVSNNILPPIHPTTTHRETHTHSQTTHPHTHPPIHPTATHRAARDPGNF